jgi:hypothetical protein
MIVAETDAQNADFSWSSSDPEVLDIGSQNGATCEAVPKSPGDAKVIVQVTLEDGTKCKDEKIFRVVPWGVYEISVAAFIPHNWVCGPRPIGFGFCPTPEYLPNLVGLYSGDDRMFSANSTRSKGRQIIRVTTDPSDSDGWLDGYPPAGERSSGPTKFFAWDALIPDMRLDASDEIGGAIPDCNLL